MQVQDNNTPQGPGLPEGCFPARHDDIWIRHIIESKSARAEEPRLKAQYMQRKLELVEGRPWEAEISGRLMSLAPDIAEKAEAAAQEAGAEGIRFRHVASIAVATVRNMTSMDVVHEPKLEDHAHSNIVAYKVPMAPILNEQATPKISQDFIKKLCDNFKVHDADKLETLEELRAGIALGFMNQEETPKAVPSVAPHPAPDLGGMPCPTTD